MAGRPSQRTAPARQEADTPGIAGLVGPAAVEQTPHHLRVGDGYVATLIVTGYPPEVGMSWLEPILAWPGRLDVVQHIEPVPAVTAAARLRRQRARLESNRRFDADRGGLGDPVVDAAAEDAADLAERVARGAARLFRVGHLLCVHAATVPELADAVAEVRAAAASVLLDTQPATWRQLQAWTSTLPLAVDSIGMRRIVDSDALAASFPFGSHDLPAPLPGEGAPAGGVLYGLSTGSNGVVWWDRWQQDNHNSVVLARSGAGKSYLVKLETLRSLYDGVHVSIIDPEGEYLRLCATVGGVAVQLGVAGVRVNPFDLPAGDRRPDALQRRAMFVHTLVGVLLGEQPPPAERAALDRAVLAAYQRAGITGDPATWHRQPPVLRDLTSALTAADDTAAHALAARLSPWVDGSFKDLFDGPSTVQPAGHLVVWSVRQLPDEQRAVGMLLALDAIWRAVDSPTAGHAGSGADGGAADVRRLVVVDEAWTLLREGEGARFLYRLSKAARKRRAGLAVVTQDAADLLGSDLGTAVVANAGTQVLLRQAPQAIDRVTERFALTAGEARMLLSAGRGEALLLAGAHRVAFQAVASAREHDLCSGDIEFHEMLRDSGANSGVDDL
ncbi:VirB4 family type IV secretion system protein, partial [Dactylosporangium cerinum]